ncbi:PAS domain-containing hybrid sensor histidine kinase/response regulator [Arenibacterium sp. CAU 1754]
MQDALAATGRPKTEIDIDYSPEQLFLTYARGRVSHFANRQIMTVIGGLTLTISDGLEIGLGLIVIALLGEALDCLYLHRVPHLLTRGWTVTRLSVISAVTGAFQALTIAVCVALAWVAPFGQSAPLFACAFLAGAAVNGGLALPFNPLAANARLSVYALTILGLLAQESAVSQLNDGQFLIKAVGIAILAYMVIAFLKFAVTGSRRNRRNLTDLWKQSRMLAEANAQLELRQKEAQRLSLVAKYANDSVVLSDGQGHVFWVNEAFTRITGYTAEDIFGKHPGALLNGPGTKSETIAALNAAARLGRPFRGEIQNVTRDGRTIWIETNQVPVLDDEGRVEMTVAIERDITQAKQSARDLAKAKEKAEEGARAKADFLATMSHEIRTPMNGIMGMADLISETDLSEEQSAYARSIRSSARALLTIINDVLDLSKLDADKMVLDPADFDLVTCLQDTVTMFLPRAGEKGLFLKLEIDRDVPSLVRADDGRLRQILVNLIGNAVKFTETGGVTVKVSADRGAPPCRLQIVIADTGIGIAPDHLEHVFERFSQAESSTTRRFGGTGLGLAISRMLARAMEGEIRVRSDPGQGSQFELTLPVARPATVRLAPRAPVTAADCLHVLSGKRVLVAEDNKVNRLLVRKYLRDIPMELLFAHDGRQAVEMAHSHAPDLILMDMSMPKMNGIEATCAIRQSQTLQPTILALTANAFASDRAACLAAGMDGFLSKPVRRSELLAEMVRHCRETVTRMAN